MKNIKIEIFNPINEIYIYMHNLFTISENNELICINNRTFFNTYIKGKNSTENRILYEILFNNKKLNVYNTDLEFINIWEKLSKRKFEIQLNTKDLKPIMELKSQNILDFKIYNKKAYISNRDGVFESQMYFDKSKFLNATNFERVFDSKTINLSPRMGEMLISTKKDGLFRGSLLQKLKIYRKPIADHSIKSNWSKFNFINYENDNKIAYFKNEVESIFDKDANINMFEDVPYRIKDFASSKFNVFENDQQFFKDQIIHSFNSLLYFFIITRDGELLRTKIDFDEIRSQNNYNKIFKIYNGIKLNSSLKNKGKPLSSHFIMNGIILEYFNEIYQIKNNKIIKIFDEPVLGIKSFPSSKKYKNIITFYTNEKFVIQSSIPFIY